MKWVAVSGSWRRSSPEIEQDVRESVAEVMERGDGIVTGGALGVDLVATEEALKHNPVADRIKIIIPTPLDVYVAHYRKRAEEGVITFEQAESLIRLLTAVKQRREQSLIEMNHSVLNEETYYDRNTKVLEDADELIAFQVNQSLGTQDTIDKAHNLGMTVTLKQYAVEG
jgi:pentose-5-phosphate-3-epimerase